MKFFERFWVSAYSYREEMQLRLQGLVNKLDEKDS